MRPLCRTIVLAAARSLGLRSPGLGSPGLRSPGLRSPGLRSPGLRSPGLRSPGPGSVGLRSVGRGLAVAVVVALAPLVLATPAHANELFQSLLGRTNKPLIDPAGFFSVVIPSGFDCQAAPRKVTCNSNRGVRALLTIDVVDVPASASVELFVLNQADAYKKKPHYRKLAEKKQMLDGARAVLASFTYDHLGNVEYPVGAQALYVVKSTKAYVIHYEGRADQFVVHKADLEQLYATFKTARIDAGGNPIVEDLDPKKNASPQMGF
jgi:hypothetical protein